MSNNEVMKLPIQNKEGGWTTTEDAILLATPSNNLAGLILGRKRESCSNRRYWLRHTQGRKSVPVKSISEEEARKIAASYFNKQKKDKEAANPDVINDLVKDAAANNDTNNNGVDSHHESGKKIGYKSKFKKRKEQKYKPKKKTETLYPVIFAEPEGFIFLLNGQEINMKTTPKKIIIDGNVSKLSFE